MNASLRVSLFSAQLEIDFSPNALTNMNLKCPFARALWVNEQYGKCFR